MGACLWGFLPTPPSQSCALKQTDQALTLNLRVNDHVAWSQEVHLFFKNLGFKAGIDIHISLGLGRLRQETLIQDLHLRPCLCELRGGCYLTIWDNFKISNIHRPGDLVSPLKLAVKCEKVLASWFCGMRSEMLPYYVNQLIIFVDTLNRNLG